MRIAVIADDLTGALDTGVQFRQWGYTVQLTDTPRHSTAEVTIINTDTRNKDPETAYNLTHTATLDVADHDIIYKKTDSTLRGNPGAELQAILDATSETKAILSPTYPPTGRRVKDGHLYVKDQLITETEYIHEYERKTSSIPEILHTETPIHCIKTPENIPETGIIVIDSETEQDLLKIASCPVRILAGSAGLADALCQSLRNPPPVLTIIGSIRTETRTQVEQLHERLGAEVIPLDNTKALHQTPQQETMRRARAALKGGKDAVITSSPTVEAVEQTRLEAQRLDLTPEELEDRITEALAASTKRLLHNLSGIIITVAATALAVTKQLGTRNIEILDEVQPGVPVLMLDNITAVTKAGGFGQPDILIQATKYLKRKHR
ncbi:four-carbon acid sugar kinase family protein [Candidatus Bathyarchaeota archaeon]|nr:MAG: four-carbon acid sugar kinase family protein [Candidatus Bathyarchaeota archaeon]